MQNKDIHHRRHYHGHHRRPLLLLPKHTKGKRTPISTAAGTTARLPLVVSPNPTVQKLITGQAKVIVTGVPVPVRRVHTTDPKGLTLLRSNLTKTRKEIPTCLNDLSRGTPRGNLTLVQGRPLTSPPPTPQWCWNQASTANRLQARNIHTQSVQRICKDRVARDLIGPENIALLAVVIILILARNIVPRKGHQVPRMLDPEDQVTRNTHQAVPSLWKL